MHQFISYFILCISLLIVASVLLYVILYGLSKTRHRFVAWSEMNSVELSSISRQCSLDRDQNMVMSEIVTCPRHQVDAQNKVSVPMQTSMDPSRETRSMFTSIGLLISMFQIVRRERISMSV